MVAKIVVDGRGDGQQSELRVPYLGQTIELTFKRQRIFVHQPVSQANQGTPAVRRSDNSDALGPIGRSARAKAGQILILQYEDDSMTFATIS